VVIDRQVGLVLPVRLAVNIDGSGRVVMSVLAVHLLDRRSWVRLHDLPALAVVQLHPVVLAVFDLAGALECLRKELTQVVVVRGVLEPEVADVAQVFVELLCSWLAMFKPTIDRGNVPGKLSQRSLIGVVCFFSPIFSYFCLLVAALRPCHGSPPRRKYMKT
jgi:hypothetical protein